MSHNLHQQVAQCTNIDRLDTGSLRCEPSDNQFQAPCDPQQIPCVNPQKDGVQATSPDKIVKIAKKRRLDLQIFSWVVIVCYYLTVWAFWVSTLFFFKTMASASGRGVVNLVIWLFGLKDKTNSSYKTLWQILFPPSESEGSYQILIGLVDSGNFNASKMVFQVMYPILMNNLIISSLTVIATYASNCFWSYVYCSIDDITFMVDSFIGDRTRRPAPDQGTEGVLNPKCAFCA